MPADADIELRFDRYLLPTTVNRQSIWVYSHSPDLHFFLEPHYDMVERVVRFSLPGGGTWPRAVRYGVEILVPSEPIDPGFRAFDGAPLTESGSAPLKFSFRVQSGEPAPAEPPPEPATCADALLAFARGGCQNGGCHNPRGTSECDTGYAASTAGEACVQVPRMGLDLSSAEGIQTTAIRQPAHQTETGPNSGVAMEDPDRFGVQMPVIDPSRPGNSYLMYKLLRQRALWDRIPCKTRYRVDLAGECPEPSADELVRLREWFVTGQPMPPGDDSLARPELDILREWITAGAPRDDCE